MSILNLISELDDRGIRLAVGQAGGLDIDAPRGALTPDLLARISQHKPELLRDYVAVTHRAHFLHTPLSNYTQSTPAIVEKNTGDSGDGDETTKKPRKTSIVSPQAPVLSPLSPQTDWPGDIGPLADFVLLLDPDDLPEVPFSPRPAATVMDAARYLAALQADIRRGPAGPRARYGALQDDLLGLSKKILSPEKRDAV